MNSVYVCSFVSPSFIDVMFLKFIRVIVSVVHSLLPILKNCLLKAPVILSLLKNKANNLRNKTKKERGKKKRANSRIVENKLMVPRGRWGR